MIEACRTGEVADPPAVRAGRRPSAAPGRIVSNRLASVRAEFERAAAIYRQAGHESELVLSVSGQSGDGPSGTDTALRAFAAGTMYYDPGIKLENASTDKPKPKKRSQFRVASKNIAALYETVEAVEL